MTRSPLLALLYPFIIAACAAPKFTDAFSALSPPPTNGGIPHLEEYPDVEGNQVQKNGVTKGGRPLPYASPTTGITSSTTYTNTATTVARPAIILNTNARSVSEDLVPIAESIFGKEYVYVTTSEEEAKQAAASMMQQNISMVIPVGGDGTLSSLINFLCSHIRETFPFLTVEEAMKELPLVAYLPLGTGNGVGSVVGSELMFNNQPTWKIFGQKRRKLRNVENILKSFHEIAQQMNENPDYLNTDLAPDVVEIPMMEVSYPDSKLHDDTLCFFAGAGFDSLMLQDFQSVKKWAIRTKILTKTLSSVAGYCVALVVKTLPKCVTRQEHNIQVRLTTRDPETLWVDHRRGDVVQQVGPTSSSGSNNKDGETLLYQGMTGILAAGTSPFYGGGLRLFPFARMTKDKMHLRLGRIHPLRGFFNIPQIFEGSFRDKRSSSFGCMDYIGGDFDVFISTTATTSDSEDESDNKNTKGFPVQHSGESVGYFERFRLRVVKQPVRFVTLMRKRVVNEAADASYGAPSS